jgi:hypothetical protein
LPASRVKIRPSIAKPVVVVKKKEEEEDLEELASGLF